MALLTDQISFTGTPSGADLIHMVDVSDPTDNVAGSSFKISLSGLTNYFDNNISSNYWVSGSTGNFSLKAINDSGLDATDDYAYAEGNATLASGPYSHAEGLQTQATAWGAHAQNRGTLASGVESHAEGRNTVASGNQSHAQGENTLSSGSFSHAEGQDTEASGNWSHAQGLSTTASGNYSHSAGRDTLASGNISFVQGFNSTASADNSAILGGTNNNILNSATNSIILGGIGTTATTINTVYMGGVSVLKEYTVSSIPSASSVAGGIAIVTDSSGSTAYTPAYSNGSSWRRFDNNSAI
jgi:hypothetical protein